MSPSEQIQALTEALQAERKTLALVRAIHAQGVNVDEDVAQRLIDVEFDGDNNVTTDVGAALADLLTRFPGLVTPSGPNQSLGTRPSVMTPGLFSSDRRVAHPGNGQSYAAAQAMKDRGI